MTPMQLKARHFFAPGASRVRDVLRLAYLFATELAPHGAIEVIVRPVKSRRTLEQNAKLWAMLGAADALSHAAVTGDISEEQARDELVETILAMVRRSK